jgi:hypothetical protein
MLGVALVVAMEVLFAWMNWIETEKKKTKV